MKVEIERKFLVNLNYWNTTLAKEHVKIEQGYISETPTSVVRVRTKGKKGFLTIKENTSTIKRAEFEYEIPYADAQYLLHNCCNHKLLKTRYLIPQGKYVWEVDVFAGKHEGLILAEIELSSIDEQVELPIWIGKEVSDDARYYNVYLAKS